MMKLYSLIGMALATVGAGVTPAQVPGSEWDAAGHALESLLATTVSAASRAEERMLDAPASVTIVTAEDIERYGYRTLDEVLATVPGFFTATDLNYSYAGVRGFARPTDYNNRILLMVDGLPVNEQVYGSALLGTEFALDLERVERVEIVRGPGSALYGTGAMFAVVDVKLKTGARTDGADLCLEGGSDGKRGAAAAWGTRSATGIDVAVGANWTRLDGGDVYFPEFDSPATNHGIAHNLNWDDFHSGVVRIERKGLSGLGLVTSRQRGIPTAPYEAVFNDARAKSLDDNYLIRVRQTVQTAPDQTLALEGFWHRYLYRGWYPYEDGLQKDATANNRLGLGVNFTWDVYHFDRFMVGVEYSSNRTADYHLWTDDRRIFDGDFPFEVFSAYFQNQTQVTRDLALTLGVRRDNYSRAGSATTPRASAVWHATVNSTFKLIYGEAFRAPNVYEMFYEEPGEAKVNPDLKPERIRTGEWVWEQRVGRRILTGVSAFTYRMRDLIEQTIDPADSLAVYRNTSRVFADGLEAWAAVRLDRGMGGYASAAWVRARDRDADETLSNYPDAAVKGGVSVPVHRLVTAATEVRYESGRKTLRGARTGAAALVGMNLTASPPDRHWSVSLKVSNLFDRAWATPGGWEHRQDTLPQPGRTWTLKVKYHLR